MRVLKGRGTATAVSTAPVDEAPLADSNLPGRTTDKTALHFFEKLVATGQKISVPLQSRPAANTLIPLSTGPFKIAPFIKDEVSQNKLVPPGQLVGNREVMLLINLTESSGAPVKTPIKQLKLAVRNDETYEEYLRVLPDVATILNTASYFKDFAKNFFNGLPGEGPPSADQLETQGKALWDHAVTEVQTSTDDRLLYWARLQAIGALRAYYKRNRLGQPPITQFEWPSRGLELDGSVSFGTGTTARKAIVTGYDPFQLPSLITQCNPSGLVALWFSGKTLTPSQGQTAIRTAIFPVRYKDFDDGLVEKAITSGVLNQIVLLMTCSQGLGTYDLERFAATRKPPLNSARNPAPTADGNADWIDRARASMLQS